MSPSSTIDTADEHAPGTGAPRGSLARRLARRGVAGAAAAVLVCTTGGLAWWGTASSATHPTSVAPEHVPAPAGDSTYVCPMPPGNSLGAVDVQTATGTTTLTPLGEASTTTYAGQPLEAGAGTTVTRQDAEGGTLVVGASGTTTASASGTVTTAINGGDLRGLAAASCTQPSSVSWIVGGSGAVGSSSELRLTNPGSTTVTAALTLYSSVGPLTLPAGGKVSVPAGQTTAVLLESAASADARLAVSIETEGGSLVPSLVTESLEGETPAGIDMLMPGAAPATEVTIPGVDLAEATAQGDAPDPDSGAASADASAVRLVNPGSHTATVAVHMLGAEGDQVLPGAEAVQVDPGAVMDISLAGVTPGTYGIRLVSDQPVTGAARVVRTAGEYPQRSGVLARDIAWVQAQSPAAVTAGTLTLPRAEGMTSSMSLSNAAPLPAVVTLTSADGGWEQEVTVEGGSSLLVDVPAEVSTVLLSAPEGSQVAASALVAAKASGDAAIDGTLLAIIAPVPDAAAASARSLLVR